MQNPLSVKRMNKLLARELGYEHGHPRYQWVFGANLMMPMVLFDDFGKIVYDYFCRCGKNQSVHLATCNYSQARPKWEKRCLAPGKEDWWVLCRRMPPEASRDDWESHFGGVPYPSAGYLVPVGDSEKQIAVSSPPELETTEEVIRKVKLHFEHTGKWYSDKQREQWQKNEDKLRETLRLRCKDAFPVHEGFPGEKHDWSAGGDQSVDSPHLRRIVTPDEAAAKPPAGPIIP